MTDRKDLDNRNAPLPKTRSGGGEIDRFLEDAGRLAPAAPGRERARLVFALDATMSRQPTWDLACKLQGEMFEAAGRAGGLAVQLVYFRGFSECRASQFVADARALTALMTAIGCRGGHTQIGRVLRHVRTEAGRGPVKAMIYVGDAMEENADDLCAVAGELGLLGIKAFMFQEGHDRAAAVTFREVARLTGGAYERFDAGAAATLAGLLRAAAVYASGGEEGLRLLARSGNEDGARRLLASMGRGA